MFSRILLPILIASQLFAFALARRPTVYIMRHGEKPDEGEGLNAVGWERSQCTMRHFNQSHYDIGLIMAQKINSRGRHRRPYESVLPLADILTLTVDTHCKKKKPKCVRRAVEDWDGEGDILISWSHKNMRKIAQELGYDDAPDYPGDRFDLIWEMRPPYEEFHAVYSHCCPGIDEDKPECEHLRLATQDL